MIAGSQSSLPGRCGWPSRGRRAPKTSTNLTRTTTTVISIVSIALLLSSAGKIDCDVNATTSVEAQNATLTTTTTTTTTGAPAHLRNQTASNEVTTGADYKQRPMPAGSLDLKINYDTQHVASAESQPPVTSSPASTTPTTPTTTISVDSTPESATASPPSRAPAEPGRSFTTLEVAANEPQGQDELLGVAESAQVATGELIMSNENLATVAAAEGVDMAASFGPGASSEDARLDADTASVQEEGAGTRHGRASPVGQLPGYSAPASSRLSAYSPSNLVLQNSRSHPQSFDEAQIGAQPLQFGHQQNSRQHHLQIQTTTPAITTTTTTTTKRPKPTGPFDPIIVCYLGSWSTYRPSLAKFTPENINPFLCTHIIYAFAGLSSTKYELKPFDSYNDITQGGYRKFTSLKEHNKQLKTLIAVGGWNEGSAR